MLKIKLYPCFNHLLDFNNIWLYSDPHFNDPEMPYIRKNYIGDAEQIKRINSKVGSKDVIFILGDIGDTSWVSQIRGYKILVMGNHDAGASNYKRIKYNCAGMGIPNIDNYLFNEVYEGPVCIADKIILSHEPLNLNCMLNIHGHTHAQSTLIKDNNHLCVCAEHIDYTPISLLPIIKEGGLSKITSIHRQTINTATKRKIKRENKGK